MQRTAYGRRPVGVVLLAALGFLTGGLELLAGAGVAGLGDIEAAGGAWPVAAGLAGWFKLAGVWLLGAGVLQVLFAWGSWKLRRWAWWAGLAVNLLWVLGAAAGLIGGIQWQGATAAGLAHVAVCGYLLTPRVRRAFAPPRASAGAAEGPRAAGAPQPPSLGYLPEAMRLGCAPDAFPARTTYTGGEHVTRDRER
ncbi:MAG TPA: hypothetical protein VHS99_04935 [Chloroflexota bacterium]|nr:hypothetical protein [Chloroflexota bacterium]